MTGPLPGGASPPSRTDRIAIVTLTTDFGTRDPYVGEMKGVILGIAGTVQLVDVTHEIEAQDVFAGALVLESAARAFPPGTVHVAVVDPGVGTARRALALVASGQCFVGPDNGLFTPFLLVPGWRAFELRAPEYRREPVSRTFHGRDVFAPAAAYLVRGVPPERFGPPVGDPVRLEWPAARTWRDRVVGAVVHVDRFGNLITSIPARAVGELGPPLEVSVAGRTVPVVETYGDLRPGGLGALVSSRDRLEIAVRDGSAARVLSRGRRGAVGRGAPVWVSRRRPASRGTRTMTSSRRRTRTSPRGTKPSPGTRS